MLLTTPTRMATSIEEIKVHLDNLGIKYKPHDEVLGLLYGTDSYRNTVNQENSVIIFISVENDGEIVRLMIPNAYKFANEGSSYNKLALMQTLLQITYKTKLLQFEYDPDDGEIRITLDIPVMDSLLTQNQLKVCIQIILRCIEEYNDHILDAMRHGLAPESDEERRLAWEEFKRVRAAERARKLGG